MRHLIDILLTDVWEERMASIFRVEEKKKNLRVRNKCEQVLTDTSRRRHSS
ncbi:hypothetical protein B7P43_G14673 [Cryptotermes secundus]|uniref:Uncharacterized protein n=1 Tax=Cryptotermes secundus TaxID=105785 RepID=A0A2J7PFS5_9NEOP|nr:hypothetical protein B7P43_G14673 [Cryptotermes secundus]